MHSTNALNVRNYPCLKLSHNEKPLASLNAREAKQQRKDPTTFKGRSVFNIFFSYSFCAKIFMLLLVFCFCFSLSLSLFVRFARLHHSRIESSMWNLTQKQCRRARNKTRAAQVEFRCLGVELKLRDGKEEVEKREALAPALTNLILFCEHFLHP